ncbi:MAG: FTR1 family protein [Actinomycetota bacterium]
MGASFLITLREGLEISLVLAILIGYLVKTGRADRVRSVWTGAGVATALCIVGGIAVHLATNGLHGKSEQAVEGFIAVAAASVLTWMILWMHRNARHMGGQLRARVDEAATSTAVAAIAFVAVVREGLETALFLISAENGGASGTDVVVGGLFGLAVAAVLGVFVYRAGSQADLRTFFRWTGVMLIFFAAGLVGKAVHELRELFGFEGGLLFDPMWTVQSGPLSKDGGAVYDFMKGLFGWAADPERIRVVAYFAYLLPVLWLFLRPSKPAVAAAPAEERITDTVGSR